MKINTNYSSKVTRLNHQTFGQNAEKKSGLHMNVLQITNKLGTFPGEEAQRVEGQLEQLADNYEIHVTPISSRMMAPELDRAIVTVLPKGTELTLWDKIRIRRGKLGNAVYQVSYGFGDRLVQAAEAGKKALSLA